MFRLYAIACFLFVSSAGGFEPRLGTSFGQRSRQVPRVRALCPPLEAPLHGAVSCHRGGGSVPCRPSGHLPGTVADFECDEHFVAEPTPLVECKSNGTWSEAVPVCVAGCGKRSPQVPLVLNGAATAPGAFPWQVAIYNLVDGEHEFWCGGSLISQRSVVTAAHCAWRIPAENLVAAFGKFFRDYAAEESDIQKIRVTRAEMPDSYQDAGGNYNGDLAVLFLERPVDVGSLVGPICIDWHREHVDGHLADGSFGTVLGWGLTENDTFSRVLRSVRLPVKSHANCIARQQRDFRKFVTYTSFCAGFRNGSGVCNGDSGGGMAFLDERSGTWFLQGVVSVSPRKRGTSFCDPNFYTVFTKVTVFVPWLMKMREVEQQLTQMEESNRSLKANGSAVPSRALVFG